VGISDSPHGAGIWPYSVVVYPLEVPVWVLFVILNNQLIFLIPWSL